MLGVFIKRTSHLLTWRRPHLPNRKCLGMSSIRNTLKRHFCRSLSFSPARAGSQSTSMTFMLNDPPESLCLDVWTCPMISHAWALLSWLIRNFRGCLLCQEESSQVWPACRGECLNMISRTYCNLWSTKIKLGDSLWGQKDLSDWWRGCPETHSQETGERCHF